MSDALFARFAEDHVAAQFIIANALREFYPMVNDDNLIHARANAIIARLASANPPLVICRPEDLKDD